MNTRRMGTLVLLSLLPISPGRSQTEANETDTTTPPSRICVPMDDGWRFCRGDFATGMSPGFDDEGWQRVDLPHDWSSEGPFSAEFGSGNGYAPGGVGWYRKRFRVQANLKDKVAVVEFDGVYDRSQVWLNGHYVGGRPYGYSSFECPLTPLLKFGAEDNVLAVRVDHSRFADSRWYTGSGIYRHVRLRLTDELRIGQWGTFVTTPEASAERAVVQVETTVENGADQARAFTLQSEVLDPDHHVAGVLFTPATIADGTNLTLVQKITVSHPLWWSTETPVLYTLRSRITAKDAVVDELTTFFGIRTIRFDPDRGFFLNGKPTKFKGVCIHHDAGSLGAAVPDKVLERRLRRLRELGANAIRTSHNPPAPELLDLCDRLGLLVKDEAFDEFTPAKNKWVGGRNAGEPSRFGYAELFDQWSVIDMQDLVRRDRNHPSVILWSIGNEIDYPNDPFSHPVLGNNYRPANPPAEQLVTCARPLIAAVKALDPTRPVTAALAHVAMSDAVGLGELLDVVGYNYQESRYAADHEKYPHRFIFGSENGGQPGNWAVVQTNEYVAGQFLWTGIDYLGEANRWPNRGSGAGLLDLCGFKKPFAWLRQSLWTENPMVYLCAMVRGRPGGMGGRRWGFGPQEHWNWSTNDEVTVVCYTTCPEVTLTLNEQPLGTKRLAEVADGRSLFWQVRFAPGVLRAVGTKDGKAACAFALTTAEAPSRIELVPESTALRADGQDVGHVEFRVVDARGVRVPDAAHELTFRVEGPARIIGLENGDLNSPETGKNGVRKAYRGRGLAMVQTTREPGRVRLFARGEGLPEASVEIEARP